MRGGIETESVDISIIPVRSCLFHCSVSDILQAATAPPPPAAATVASSERIA